MNLFPIHKSVKVATYNLPNDIIPKFMYQDLKQVNENKFGCPAVGSLNKRMYEINSMFDIEIEFGIKDNEPYYKYKYPTNIYKDVKEVHKVIDYKISTLQSSQDVLTLQFIIDTVFVTDNKNLEIITLPSLDNLETENCRFVSGTYKPYAWIRNLNASWLLLDTSKPAYVKLSMDKSLLTFLFNLPVNIKEIEPTTEMINYHKYMYGIVNFRKKILKAFPQILSKRPHKFL